MRSACYTHQRDRALRRSVERPDRFLRWLQQHFASLLREIFLILILRRQADVAFLAAADHDQIAFLLEAGFRFRLGDDVRCSILLIACMFRQDGLRHIVRNIGDQNV